MGPELASGRTNPDSGFRSSPSTGRHSDYNVTTTPGEDARSVIKARNKGAGHGHFRPPMASAEKHQIRLIIPRSQVRSLPAPPISPDAGAQVCSGRYVKGAASTKSPDTSPARVGPSSATRRRAGAPGARSRLASSVQNTLGWFVLSQ